MKPPPKASMKKSAEIFATIGLLSGDRCAQRHRVRRRACARGQARVAGPPRPRRARRRGSAPSASPRASAVPSEVSKQRGQRREQPAQRVAAQSSSTLYQAKTRVRSASVVVAGKQRLLEDRDRAAVAAVHVEHADERGGERRAVKASAVISTTPAEHRQRRERHQQRAFATARAEEQRERARRAPRPRAPRRAPRRSARRRSPGARRRARSAPPSARWRAPAGTPRRRGCGAAARRWRSI